MLTHNALKYVRKSIKTVKQRTQNVDYELVVVDNASRIWTRLLLKSLKKHGFIDTLYFSPQNLLFAKGNNQASALCREESDLFLLLNSDICIRSDDWLEKLIGVYPTDGGICAYGIAQGEPLRADGYCLLIDADIFHKYKMDEKLEWFWSVTKLESQVLKENKRVVAVKNHERYLHHYGGKSGRDFRHAAGMNTEISTIKKWFSEKCVEVIDHI